MTDGARYIPAAEFRSEGFLQEVNRCFLHPLGLALEVVVNEDGSEVIGGVWDYRADPEGMIFGVGQIDPAKIARVKAERDRHAATRKTMMGRVVQQPTRRWHPDLTTPPEDVP